MKKRCAQGFLMAALAFLMGTGCAINQIQHVEQPATAAPGSAIDVYVIDMYQIFAQDSVLAAPWVRSNVLLGAALPAGWSVNSASYYIDTNAYDNLARYADASQIDIAHIMDSLSGDIQTPAATQDYDATLTSTYGLTGLEPHAYLGTNPINIPAGTVTDTVVEDTANNMMFNLKLVGCYVHFNITTGTVEDTFDLGYFVAFSPESLANAEAAENSYSDSNFIEITSNTGIASVNRQIRMEITGNPVNAKSLLSYYVPGTAQGEASLALVDARGNILESRTIAAQTGWNREQLGSLTRSDLQPGVYFLQITAGNTVTRHRLVITE